MLRKVNDLRVIDQLTNSYADEFHKLDRALFQRNSSGGSRVIQFTSSILNEGVTSLLLSFAKFMSKLHGSEDVVVVEANLRRPAFNDIFESVFDKSATGIFDKNQENDIVYKLAEGFSIIPAGQANFDKVEFETHLEYISGALGELRSKFRYILLDTPAVIPYIDSAIIAGETDGVVLVIESNRTRYEVVNDAIERLTAGGGRIVGTILNKREFHIPKWLYGRL